MPRPIPDDVENVTGFIWYLIPVPDDPVFVQAAWDAFSELTYPWNWGKEGERVPESDIAAQLWSDAIYEALRVRDMGFPDDVLTYIDEIEGLLTAIKNLSGCCGEQDPTGGDFYTDRVEDGTGDVPQNIIDAGYATGVSDWEGFAAYKCMIANVVIDDAKEKLTRLIGLVDAEGNDIVGGIGAITAVLGFIFAVVASGGIALVAGIIAALGTAAAFYDELFDIGVTVATQVVADLEANRDAIACAIYQADGDAAALAAFYQAVDDEVGLDGGALVRTLNMSPVVKALYSGRYDQQNVAQALSDAGFSVGGYSCICDIDFDFLFESAQVDMQAVVSDATEIGWDQVDDTPVDDFAACSPLYQIAMNAGGRLRGRASDAAAYESYTLPPSFTSHIERVELDVCFNAGQGTLTINYADATSYQAAVVGTGLKTFDPPNPEKTVVDITLDGTPNNWHVTNVKIFWRIEEI